MLWGIQYIVCMCIIIIDITDIRNDCMGTSRVFGGGWAAIIVSIWREAFAVDLGVWGVVGYSIYEGG